MRHATARSVRAIVSAAALLLITSLAHAEADFYLGLGLGGGDVDLNGDVSGSGDFDTVDLGGERALTGEVTSGVQFNPGWLAELSIVDYENLSLLLVDSVSYDAVRLGIGYAPQPTGRFGFVGKIGIAFWDLELRESPLFNSGSEATFNTDGEDLYLQVGGEFHATDRWRIGAAYDYSDADFGDVSALRLNTRYLFGR